MHIYFSGIGGTGMGPLALIAKEAGYEVSGSDSKDSQYIDYLKKKGIKDIHIGQTYKEIKAVHEKQPIDWLVYTSAISIENPQHPELEFARAHDIKLSKRDELLNKVIKDNDIKLIAVAGTHGKTTTTAMIIWLFKELGISISYSVGAKIDFGDMGHADLTSEYFVLEADEFDRNFLSFEPEISVITGLAYDHHEIYPTQGSYNQSFTQFIDQSKFTILWQADRAIAGNNDVQLEDELNPKLKDLRLAGLYNRRDAWLAVQTVNKAIGKEISELIEIINRFPGVSRRFEKLAENLYSDYAHTPEKISGAMSVAKETLKPNQKLVIVYEPLTNRRMHHTAAQHKDIFKGADKIYWVPSYLAREDKDQKVLSPAELIDNLSPELQKIAEAATLDAKLKDNLHKHLDNGDMVLALSGGGGGSLDEWLRSELVD
jgi:UDP-N-acetylmuramate--alanine ligase